MSFNCTVLHTFSVEYNLIKVPSTPEEDDDRRAKTIEALIQETDLLDADKTNKSTNPNDGASVEPHVPMESCDHPTPATSGGAARNVPVKRTMSPVEINPKASPNKVPNMQNGESDGQANLHDPGTQPNTRGKGKGVGKNSKVANRRRPKP